MVAVATNLCFLSTQLGSGDIPRMALWYGKSSSSWFVDYFKVNLNCAKMVDATSIE